MTEWLLQKEDIGAGRVTPEEAPTISAIVAKRAELCASVELAAEIEALGTTPFYRPDGFCDIQYSTTGFPGEPVPPTIRSGAQMKAPS